MRYPAFLALAALLVPLCAYAQSDESIPIPDKTKTPTQAHHVWNNEEVQQLQGGISIVGNTPASKPVNRAVTHVGPPPRPPVQFRATTVNGEDASSERLTGWPVLVQFWATWCPKCRSDQAPLDHIAQSFANDGLVVLAVDYDESAATVYKYLKTSPRAVPIILGKDTNLQNLCKVTGFPTYLMINADGQIVGTRSGSIGEEGMRKLVNAARLGTNQPVPPR